MSTVRAKSTSTTKSRTQNKHKTSNSPRAKESSEKSPEIKTGQLAIVPNPSTHPQHESKSPESINSTSRPKKTASQGTISPLPKTATKNQPKLQSLALQSGSIAKLDRDLDAQWADLSKKLEGQVTDKSFSGDLKLGQFVLEIEADGKPTSGLNALAPIHDAMKPFQASAQDVLYRFLEHNGQLGYIHTQDWFKSKQFRVLVEMNYYYNREAGDVPLRIHKDTGGANLFLNLMFDNQNPIPATELFTDLGDASEARKALRDRALPGGFIRDIDKLNQEGILTNKGRFPGGVIPQHGFVSSVDEAFYHSSYFKGARPKYKQDKVESFLLQVKRDSRFPDAEEGKSGQDFDADPSTNWMDMMMVIAKSHGTELNRVLLGKKLSLQKLGYEDMTKIWDEVYGGTTDEEILIKDIAAVPWNKKPKNAEFVWANTSDAEPDVVGSQVSFQMIKLGGLRRANSFRDESMTLAKKNKAPRNFIRTWVKVQKVAPLNIRTAVDAFDKRIAPDQAINEFMKKYYSNDDHRPKNTKALGIEEVGQYLLDLTTEGDEGWEEKVRFAQQLLLSLAAESGLNTKKVKSLLDAQIKVLSEARAQHLKAIVDEWESNNVYVEKLEDWIALNRDLYESLRGPQSDDEDEPDALTDEDRAFLVEYDSATSRLIEYENGLVENESDYQDAKGKLPELNKLAAILSAPTPFSTTKKQKPAIAIQTTGSDGGL